MSKTTITEHNEVLDEHTLQLLGESPAVLDAAPERMARLRDRVMQRVDDDIANAAASFITIHPDDGAWIELTPKIKKKVLFANPETGTEAYLLKAEAGAEAPPHVHAHDEHCLVLEGEVIFDGGIHLRKGDYHFAPGGSEHGVARTDVGVLVYIQTGQQGIPAAFQHQL